MLRLNFTKEDLNVFQHERFHHPHPHVMRKMEVLLLKASGIDSKTICRIAGVCPKTVCTYINDFNSGGIEKVRELNFYRPKSELKNHSSSIEDYLQKHPPSSVSQASAMIETLTGIKRGVTQTRNYLKSLGFSFRKAGAVPSKAGTEGKKTNSGNFWIKN
jgi:transposase